MTDDLPRTRRFLVLAVLAAAGAILFVPFLNAGLSEPIPARSAAMFVVAATGVALLATWVGLRWADRAGLPMPLLRAFEGGRSCSFDRRAVARAIVVGVGFGLLGLAALRLGRIDGSAGSVAVKVGSGVFAAVTLEAVLHLAIMSGVVLVTRRIGVGIAVATVAYVGFHLATLGGQPWSVVLVAAVANGIAGMLFGWLYARDGYEYLVIAHFVGHAITVGIG